MQKESSGGRRFSRPVRESRREKGTTLFVATTSLVFLIPIVGLAVDVGFLYAVKARLQASVDGAALAAARALNLGQTTGSQSTAAKSNAVNWFYANFPVNYMGTSGTVMSQADVQVFDDPVNPLVRNVTVQGQSNVPTYFLKGLSIFFPSGSFDFTVVRAIGNAARRDVVVVLVLDRSTSMNSNNGCSNMRAAAKLFVGQFANGRDRIGMVTFSDTVFVEQTPIQAFQASLGYQNASGTGNGKIDNIQCNGNTGIAQAVSVGYNLLFKTALPGALNVMMFMTDGLPNTLVVNLKNSVRTRPDTAYSTYSGCKDSRGYAANATSGPIGDFVNFPATWNPAVPSFGTPSYLTDIPAGTIAAIGTGDTPTSLTWGARKYWAVSSANSYNQGTISSGNAPGCAFLSNEDNFDSNDIGWMPNNDVYGNSLDTGYRNPINRVNGKIRVDQQPTMQNAAFNAADDAARRARVNATLPAYVFAVGLGGTGQTPPDYVLLQRMANDPNRDLYNTPSLYPACSAAPNCTTSTSQPSGTFIFSSDPGDLAQSFLKISSMILRLSR